MPAPITRSGGQESAAPAPSRDLCFGPKSTKSCIANARTMRTIPGPSLGSSSTRPSIAGQAYQVAVPTNTSAERIPNISSRCRCSPSAFSRRSSTSATSAIAYLRPPSHQ